jgi:cell division protein FtsX
MAPEARSAEAKVELRRSFRFIFVVALTFLVLSVCSLSLISLARAARQWLPLQKLDVYVKKLPYAPKRVCRYSSENKPE